MKEPKVPRYSRHISQLCLRRKIVACVANDALASAMSFMPTHAASEAKIIQGTQMKAAFCVQTCTVWPFLMMFWASPPNTPNTPAVTTSGLRNCTTDTPRLPRPAFTPSAEPLRSFGKKKLMLDMLELKLPPPKPHSNASISMVGYVVVLSCTAKPIPIAGISRLAVEIAVQRRPPTTGTMNE